MAMLMALGGTGIKIILIKGSISECKLTQASIKRFRSLFDDFAANCSHFFLVTNFLVQVEQLNKI